MRLIDADVLKEYIHKQNGRPVIGMTFGEMIEMFINEQPTAYDIEAVVKEIKSLSGYEIYKNTFDLIIDIVRNGGVE